MRNNRLSIRNVGPIKDISINLNKINVFIGPQGSGKSTIVKILSYCSWVEKKIALSPSLATSFVNDNTFIDKLLSFHKLYGYFNDSSSFHYESNVMKIKYQHNNKKVEIEPIDYNSYKKTKISYIPAERNIVASIPNWFEVKLDDNNIRSFMADWENARKLKTTEHPLSLMNKSIEYHYEEPNKDMVSINKDVNIEMTNTASGFQSLIPLLVVVEYAAKHIYEVEDKQSVEGIRIEKKEQVRLIADYLKDNFDDATFSDILDNILSGQALQNALEISKKRIYTQCSKIIVEEIEQNLFPETQKEILYRLLELVKNENISFALTTHSPYVLFALNNCLLGGIVGDKISESEREVLPSSKSWVDPDLVSVWQINENGEVESIINSKNKTIGKHYFNTIMNDVMDEYYRMIKYLAK